MTGREPFSWPVRVYWEDTDAGGVVYHSVYLNYFERTRSEWLRSVGLDQRALHAEERIQFVVVDMNVRWIRPARYDDLLTVTVMAASISLGSRFMVPSSISTYTGLAPT